MADTDTADEMRGVHRTVDLVREELIRHALGSRPLVRIVIEPLDGSTWWMETKYES